MTCKQLDLFSQMPPKPALRQDQLVMDKDALLQWKSQIFEYQQRVRESNLPKQTTLFDLALRIVTLTKLFTLRLQSMSFYKMPADSPGESAIYFILDNAVRLILYIGETCRSNKRWKGIHDCKGYIESYQDLHYRYQLQTAVNIAFWWDTPVDRKARQELESSLILKWRSPFNFQNWHALWATVRVKELATEVVVLGRCHVSDRPIMLPVIERSRTSARPLFQP